MARFEDAMILVLPLALMSVEIKAGIETGTSGSSVRRATDPVPTITSIYGVTALLSLKVYKGINSSPRCNA